ncbi:SurA N-terminal domain-containing protein [Gellertiella hungarica]|uniref:Peptidyl-prolyl cis-trans isomerase SurA n=1 Tax=Gellertiella hungarica TaxID=1572859 RepID=A0A7W6J689_9HYPH|nr:peptidyl-prolyl cis-trans isomerase SurA [Gellertiella hungarica]
MFAKTALRGLLLGTAILAMSAGLPALTAPAHAASTSVAITVNGTAITNGDIAHRAAFLRLQKQRGNLTAMAKQQLVDEELKRREILRMQASVSTEDVDAAFARFAKSNKLTPAQLTKILDQAGVTAPHFKSYIAVQMSWPRVMSARFNPAKSNGADLAQRLGGKEKPVTTEYFLQQVVFVIPESKRGKITGKRKAEAEASRKNFPGCDGSKAFAATMRDVSIINLGRVLLPAMPPEWKPLIEKAKGNTTGTLVTPRGVEYLAICKQRQVNDDYAAEVVFRAEDLAKQKGKDPREEQFLEELRKKARITGL